MTNHEKLMLRIRIYLMYSGYWGIESTSKEKDSVMKRIASMTESERVKHIKQLSIELNKPNPYWNK